MLRLTKLFIAIIMTTLDDIFCTVSRRARTATNRESLFYIDTHCFNLRHLVLCLFTGNCFFLHSINYFVARNDSKYAFFKQNNKESGAVHLIPIPGEGFDSLIADMIDNYST